MCEVKDEKDEFSFIYGDEAITYQVVWKVDAQTDRIKIKVNPNSEVIVIANQDATIQQIQKGVMKRAKWIWQSVQEFNAHQALKTTKHYRSGEMMFYLGRRYVLKLIQSTEKPTVKLNRGQLQVYVQSIATANTEQIQTLTNQWYRTQAQRVFDDRLKALLPKTNWVDELPPFKILAMQKQWGSCSIQGCIMLNPNLIKAPKECIDYVILHELCHIAEHNHSERFWRLLTQVMPNWKELKLKLDGMAESYLI